MKRLIIGSSIAIVSIFLVASYAFFNIFNITQAQIKKLDLVITTSSSEKFYDGKALTDFNWTLTSGNLYEEDQIFGVMESSITNVGEMENLVGITILDKNDNNVTNNYNITYVIGTLKIHPRPITLESESATKMYDGLPLTHEVFKIVQGSLLSNHDLSVYIENKITNVGMLENHFDVSIYDENEVDVTSNYDITKISR